MFFLRDCFCEIWVKFGFQNKNKGNLGIICRTSNGNNASFSYSISDGPLPKRGFGLITISKSMIWKSYQTAKKKKKCWTKRALSHGSISSNLEWIGFLRKKIHQKYWSVLKYDFSFLDYASLISFLIIYIYIIFFFLVVMGVRGSRRTWLIIECVVL